MSLDTGLQQYSATRAQQFFAQVSEEARSVAGVKSAALTSNVPMNGLNSVASPRGIPVPSRAGQRLAWKRHGGRALLRDAGVAYPQGSWVSRDRYHRDTSGRRGERAARRSSYWPGQDPLGKRFHPGKWPGPTWWRSSASRRNSKYLFIMEPPREFVYFWYQAAPCNKR